MVLWDSNWALTLSSKEPSSGAALPRCRLLCRLGAWACQLGEIKLQAQGFLLLRLLLVWIAACWHGYPAFGNELACLERGWETALCGALRSTDVRGQESLVVYFLSKYKLKQGVGCFCICSALAHGSALLIMVVLSASESRTHALVPAPKTGRHKLQLIIPLSCHYQLVPSEESWQKWVIRRILEKLIAFADELSRGVWWLMETEQSARGELCPTLWSKKMQH